MRVLYISYDGLTDPLGRSQVLPYLCGLARKGHEITVLSCDKPARYAESKDKVNDIVNEYNIRWYSVLYASRVPILSALYNIWRMRHKAIRICARHGVHIVHCRSYMASFIGVLLKRVCGVKYVFDMRGFYADERVDGKVWNREEVIYDMVYRYFKWKEKCFLSSADYVVSLTHAGKRILEQSMGVTAPIKVIPCCADLQHFSISNVDIRERDQLMQRLHIAATDLVISYVGSLGTWYMLPQMMQMVSMLMRKRPETKFLLITPDSREKVMEWAAQYGIPDSRVIVEFSPRELMPTYISLSHISLFFIQPVFSKKASSPTKMGELLSMGVPLIVNAGVGDVDDIVNNTHCGYVVKEFTAEEYERAILHIDALVHTDKNILCAAAEQYYSLAAGVEQYNEIYAALQ